MDRNKRRKTLQFKQVLFLQAREYIKGQRSHR
jgi:hypothetical protein